MKIYKVKQMSGVEVPVVGKEALDALVEAANRGVRLIVTKYGVINPASIDSITVDRHRMESFREGLSYGRTEAQALGEAMPESIEAPEAVKKLK